MRYILWLEDDVSSISYSKELIEADLPIQFTVAKTIASAFKSLRKKPFDALLIDLSMPIGRQDQIPVSYKEFFDKEDSFAGAAFYRCLVDNYETMSNAPNLDHVYICSGHENLFVETVLGNVYRLDRCIQKAQMFLDPLGFGNAIFTASSLKEVGIDKLEEKSLGNAIQKDTTCITERDTSDRPHEGEELPIHKTATTIDTADQSALRLHDIRNLLTYCLPLLNNIEILLKRNKPTAMAFRVEASSIQEHLIGITTDISETLDQVPEQFIVANHTFFDSLDEISRDLDRLTKSHALAKRSMITNAAEAGLRKSETQKLKIFLKLAELFENILTSYALLDARDIYGRVTQSVELTHESPVQNSLHINTSKIIQHEVNLNEAKAAARNLEIRPEIEPDLLCLKGEHDAYVRIVQNLLDNAIKYNEQTLVGRGWITVRHFLKRNVVTTQFESWGYPVTQAELDNVIKGDGRSKKSSAPGTGKGIHIVKTELEKFGGKLSAFHQPGSRKRGSERDKVTFQINIPV